MNTHPLKSFLERLIAFRERAHELGDEQGAERLDELIERVRELIAHADDVLKRLGNPPTD